MIEKPCIIIGPDSDLGLKNCRACGLEWHKSERKPNCPYIETPSQKSERLAAYVLELEAENGRLRKEMQIVIDDCEADYPPSHGAIKHGLRAALKGGE
jgi:hypothetical protein